MLLLALLLAPAPPSALATSSGDLLAYLRAVGDSSKGFVAGLLAPRFEVRRALELLRGHMTRPWPAAALPRLDPLDVYDAPFTIRDPELGSWQGRMERARVSGLSTFRADAVTLEPLALSVSFNLTWRRLDVVGRYALSGSLADRVAVSGRGPFNVTLWDARAWGAVRLGTERPLLRVRELRLGAALGGATGRIEGLGGPRARYSLRQQEPRERRTSDVLSAATLDMAPLMVEMAGPRVAAAVADAMRDALDRRLRDNRVASAAADAWARAAATADKVLSLGRPVAGAEAHTPPAAEAHAPPRADSTPRPSDVPAAQPTADPPPASSD